MSNYYHINWLRLIKNLLPICLRKNFIVKWLRILVSPIVWLYELFKAYRLKCLYEAQHNCQIIYLEAILNDAFDSVQRRIRIKNAVFKQPIFFYDPLDERDVYFYSPANDQPVWLYYPEQFEGDGCDFYVFIPPDVELNESLRPALEIQISGLIDFYKLYSKNYRILWEQLSE